MSLFELIKTSTNLFGSGDKKKKKDEKAFLESLERREKTIRKLLKKDLKKSIEEELKDDLKSIKKLKEKIKKES